MLISFFSLALLGWGQLRAEAHRFVKGLATIVVVFDVVVETLLGGESRRIRVVKHPFR